MAARLLNEEADDSNINDMTNDPIINAIPAPQEHRPIRPSAAVLNGANINDPRINAKQQKGIDRKQIAAAMDRQALQIPRDRDGNEIIGARERGRMTQFASVKTPLARLKPLMPNILDVRGQESQQELAAIRKASGRKWTRVPNVQ